MTCHPMACQEPCNKPPFSAFTSLFIWHLGASGWTWHVESQEFGPWVQNSSLMTIYNITYGGEVIKRNNDKFQTPK
jgi:hypothetical protein